MEHTTEAQIERLLVAPEELTPRDRVCVVDHLLRCAPCRERAEVQTAFYLRLHEYDGDGLAKPALKYFLEGLLNALPDTDDDEAASGAEDDAAPGGPRRGGISGP